MELVIRLAGAAGQGIQTLGDILARGLFRHGLYVHTEMSYHSRIRGGENAYTVRACTEPCAAIQEESHVLVALSEDMLAQYSAHLAPGGYVICDERLPAAAGEVIAVPARQLAREELKLPIAAGTVLLGTLAGLLELDQTVLDDVVREVLGDKAAPNLRALQMGRARSRPGPWRLGDEARRPQGGLLMSGAEGVGLGALLGGCRFLASYPMTPGTAVMAYLAQRAVDWGMVVEQAEDEIAAVNMALGAAYAGARAMVTTSGGGFALMVEGLSLAGMIETPVVFHLGQRPSPATGLPTRTGQENLLFALHAGHGEFPRYIVAPRDPLDAIHLTAKAFELAEAFQVPAIVLTDQYLVDGRFTVARPALEGRQATNHLLSPEELEAADSYHRFAISETGVSPRAIPGVTSKLVLVDSDEHDEYGRITEDLAIRQTMVEKRLRKGERLARQVAAPVQYPPGPLAGKTVLLGWGSSHGALREAVDQLNAPGGEFALLHYTEIWPLRTAELERAFAEADRVVAVEGNATGQFAKLVAQETGRRVHSVVAKYDGRPLTARDIVRGVER
ncbi:MAG: 2-oxoacid:acceptor oxidoreductase subunit alpha [Candidatus Bipolaricaulaceae bacterium]